LNPAGIPIGNKRNKKKEKQAIFANGFTLNQHSSAFMPAFNGNSSAMMKYNIQIESN
jgi:hypothetical protein